MINFFNKNDAKEDIRLVSWFFITLCVSKMILGLLLLFASYTIPALVAICLACMYLAARIMLEHVNFNLCAMLLHINGIIYVYVNCYYFSFDYGFQFYCLHTIAFCYISIFKHRYQVFLLALAGVLAYLGVYYLTHHGYCLEQRIVLADYDLAHFLYVFHLSVLLFMFLAVVCTLRNKLYTNVIDKTLDVLVINKDTSSDILSGLNPRLNFLEILDAQEDIKQANLALIDIDRFKQINIFYGYEQGDNIIAAAANVLKHTFKDCLLCRWSGEEFLVFSPHSCPDEFYALCKDFSDRFSSLHFEPGGYSCSCSIGCLCVLNDYQNYSLDEYLNKLEKNLQDAKALSNTNIITSNI